MNLTEKNFERFEFVVTASASPFRVFVFTFRPLLIRDSKILISKFIKKFRTKAARVVAFLARLSFQNSEKSCPQFDAHLLWLAPKSDIF